MVSKSGIFQKDVSGQEAHSQSSDLFRLLVDAVQDYAIFALDPTGVILTWNAGAQRIKGYKADEIIGSHFSRFYTEYDIARRHPEAELKIAVQQGKYEEEGWRVRKDGTLFWANVVITALRDEQGTLRGFGKVTRDLTAKRKTEEELRQSQQRYKLIVDNVTDYAILSLDPKGFVTSWNAGAERLKGYAADEIIGKHFSTFYPQEDLEAGKPEMELRVATQTGRFEDEGWRLRKDGTRFWANVIITAVHDKSGELRGFSKITRDMTERKRHEEELKRSSVALTAANKELEAFCYAVSHDLRSPLRGIDGFSQAVIEDYGHKLDEQGKQYLTFIREGTQKMGKLIDDLLNLSRMTRLEMTLTQVNLSNIANAVAQTLKRLSPERKVKFEIQEGLIAKGDAGLLGVVLENLLSNAWKFTSRREDAVISFGAEDKGDTAVYFVRDNGAGFDMRYYDKLFGAFQRLHVDSDFVGTGVGLATVRRIITRHAGEIWAQSEVGKGTTFYFTL